MKLKINDPLLADRIKKVCDIVGGPSNLSRLSKLSLPTVHRLLTGSVDPSRSTLISISNAAKVSLHWLITGQGPMFQYEIPEKEDTFVKDSGVDYMADYVRIPVVSGYISAGTGVIPENNIESFCMFKRDWILRKGDPSQMSLIRVRADSMAPTLLDGDIVLVNHAVHEIFDGYIYAINIDEEIMIKRIFKDFKANLIKIKSDNPDYEAFTIEKDKIRINGLIIWYARELIK